MSRFRMGRLYSLPDLYGTRYEIRTAPKSLQWILHLDKLSGLLARWNLKFQEFDFIFFYRPDINPLSPDRMCRLNANGQDKTNIDTWPLFQRFRSDMSFNGYCTVLGYGVFGRTVSVCVSPNIGSRCSLTSTILPDMVSVHYLHVTSLVVQIETS